MKKSGSFSVYTSGMNSKQRKVLITGANRGIGYETAKQLKERGFFVVLSARDASEGQAAASELGVEFLQIDVADEKSISAAATEFKERFGDSLDVLVNNAGIYPDDDDSILEVGKTQLFHSLLTNTLGPLLVTRSFRKFLENSNEGGRLINLSSKLGQLSEMDDTAPTYSISKTALNAVTRQLSAALSGKQIAVNSVSPGWVRTDMGGDNADLSVEEGADSVVWLADEAPHSLTGKFIRDRKEIEW